MDAIARPPVAAVPGAGGAMVVVVGPSGAGKDSVMSFAAKALGEDGRVVFARRVITRPADAGGEAHEGVDPPTFARMRDEGAFCVWWEAHGLSYGIPRSALAAMADGSVVVVNGSRSALPRFEAAVPRLHVALVTARADVLADRLAGRGRESREEIEARLARRPKAFRPGCPVATFDNSGPLAEAGSAFVAMIGALLPDACR
ncbi:phosphonate metabolism protein/1,5-bisphosphokinase (PRPP-forming) PhnN [Rhizobium sp. TRM95111]|uniref:phosphonate metabolism protein/1,5-bisphosphokinase (PRPP-forming) PhnN n=1 Tax=Rhizobium alarense TaxID=2846851 RepID=UPI001F3B700D|nr:phosphonate metabolism protein/1,5-bisphosphokinase (PRPP-forming) PhnN [Rhizobium alarense]MCF3640863.1 phosphonate metabolism protein/1,5-bisphosphokinase (PRPP-forming) PhnN [Rhizobium alarense]